MKKVPKLLLSSFFAVFLAASFTFILIHLTPGDPVDFILKDQASKAEKEDVREALGLNKPLSLQYKIFLTKLIHLDLGRSLHSGEPVFQILKERFPLTFRLAFLSLLLALLWGIPLGVLSAYKGLRRYKKFFDIFPIFFISFPVFVVAPLLIWLFAVKWPLLPVSGAESFSHLILPSLSLALPLGALLMKMTRTSVFEVMSLEYVRTARAKGVSSRDIYFKHILRNALIPITTIAGLQLGALITGAVIVETIFDFPGLGTLLYQAILSRDYPVVQGAVLFIALLYIVINKLTDQAYAWIHPHLKEF